MTTSVQPDVATVVDDRSTASDATEQVADPATGLVHPPETDTPDERAVYVDAQLYDAALRIAELRGQRIEDVVARALKQYARGRSRPRHE
jgi:hypothetical protein